jgi:hypothetical protein
MTDLEIKAAVRSLAARVADLGLEVSDLTARLGSLSAAVFRLTARVERLEEHRFVRHTIESFAWGPAPEPPPGTQPPAPE